MDVLFMLIPITLVFVVVGGAIFFWSVRSGQFEDMEGPAHRILMDDDDPLIPTRRPKDRDGDTSETTEQTSDLDNKR